MTCCPTGTGKPWPKAVIRQRTAEGKKLKITGTGVSWIQGVVYQWNRGGLVFSVTFRWSPRHPDSEWLPLFSNPEGEPQFLGLVSCNIPTLLAAGLGSIFFLPYNYCSFTSCARPTLTGSAVHRNGTSMETRKEAMFGLPLPC